MASDYVKLKTVEMRGQVLGIYVGDRSGFFYVMQEGKENPASYDARLAEGKTLEDALEKAKRVLAAKKVEVRIRFNQVFDHHIRPAVARGLHQKTGETLVTYLDDNSTDQLRSYADTLRPMTSEEMAPLEQLGAAIREKQKEARQLVEWYEKGLKPFQHGSRFQLVNGKQQLVDDRIHAQVKRAIEAKMAARLTAEDAGEKEVAS